MTIDGSEHALRRLRPAHAGTRLAQPPSARSGRRRPACSACPARRGRRAGPPSSTSGRPRPWHASRACRSPGAWPPRCRTATRHPLEPCRRRRASSPGQARRSEQNRPLSRILTAPPARPSETDASRIALNLILGDPVVAEQPDPQAVQESARRRPQPWCGIPSANARPGAPPRVAHQSPAVKRLGDDAQTADRRGCRRREDHPVAAQIGPQIEVIDMRRAHGLEPHRLPDPARRRVIDRVRRAGDLLADRLAGAADRIDVADHQLVRPALSDQVRDVEGERVIVAAMGPGEAPVDVHASSPADGAEVQQQMPPGPAARHRERAPVPARPVLALDPRQRRLGRKRHQDRLRQVLPKRRHLPRHARADIASVR